MHGFLLDQYAFMPHFVFIVLTLSEFLKKKQRIRSVVKIKGNNNSILMFVNL